MKKISCDKGMSFLAGLLFFAILFALYAFMSVESANHAAEDASIRADLKLGIPKYDENSSELAELKIQKGNMLIEEGRKNIGSSTAGNERARALINKGTEELNEGLRMLNETKNKNNS